MGKVPDVGSQGDPLYVLPEGLTEREQELVDDAVAWLLGEVRESGLDLAVRVHAYVIDRFFAGSYAAFAEPSRVKPRSFAALVEHEALPLKRATLYNLIRVGEQLGQLPPKVARGLTVKHHRALMPLAASPEQSELAERAVAERWTATQLADEVRKVRPPTRPGRKAEPQLIKDFRAFQRTVRGSKVPPVRAVASLNDGERKELASALSTIEARITALRRALAAVPED